MRQSNIRVPRYIDTTTPLRLYCTPAVARERGGDSTHVAVDMVVGRMREGCTSGRDATGGGIGALIGIQTANTVAFLQQHRPPWPQRCGVRPMCRGQKQLVRLVYHLMAEESSP